MSAIVHEVNGSGFRWIASNQSYWTFDRDFLARIATFHVFRNVKRKITRLRSLPLLSQALAQGPNTSLHESRSDDKLRI
jgi:hypothetical protein